MLVVDVLEILADVDEGGLPFRRRDDGLDRVLGDRGRLYSAFGSGVGRNPVFSTVGEAVGEL